MAVEVTGKKGRARLLVIFSACLWSMGALSVKVLPETHPMTITFFRSLSGTIFFLFYLYVWKQDDPSRTAEKKAPRFFGVTWKETAGGLAYGATTLTFFAAVRLTTAANATILQHTSPVWVALAGYIFLKEKTFLRDWISIFFVLAGVFLCMSGKIERSGTFGNVLALLSGLAFSFLVIIMRSSGRRSSIRSLILGNIFTIAVSAPLMIRDEITAGAVLVPVFLGVFQLFLPFILYNYALVYIRAVESTILKTIEPVLSPVWVALAVREIPSPESIAGGVLVITVIVVWTLRTEKKIDRKEV
ncbi:MAG: DMT family transporter [Spirochaetia bacterium]